MPNLMRGVLRATALTLGGLTIALIGLSLAAEIIEIETEMKYCPK